MIIIKDISIIINRLRILVIEMSHATFTIKLCAHRLLRGGLLCIFFRRRTEERQSWILVVVHLI